MRKKMKNREGKKVREHKEWQKETKRLIGAERWREYYNNRQEAEHKVTGKM